MKVEIGGVFDPSGGLNPPRPGYVQADAFMQPGVEVLCQVEALPFRNLDSIYMSHVLEHIAEAMVMPALQSCRRALKAGGTLEIFVPDLLAQMRRVLRAAEPNDFLWGVLVPQIFGSHSEAGQGHKTGFSSWRLANCLRRAGFRRVETRRRLRRERTIAVLESQANNAVTTPYLVMEVQGVAYA